MIYFLASAPARTSKLFIPPTCSELADAPVAANAPNLPKMIPTTTAITATPPIAPKTARSTLFC